ncbi:MAG TPA: Gfo/Idh/MocA family oxidoreductase [Candidatus Aminicenantes bacterium]|nr:Gfo/Idh/MocA family oxidoreductase [Candidatus Aminicenantes bacterium]HRY65787.1 Gfo/Idh/MocA family oxidoreductase [Candidatus Aminicenantes bacterium]HRZ72701.1 Gfo/Idh/MocA family oxidoreductase [Candidatus Aminicenantes bacterium]
MAEPVSLVLVGIGGMGAVYLQALLERREEGLFRIAGAVDPQPNRCRQYVEMRAMGVPCFVSLQDFYRNRKADLAILSSPIQVHMPQTAFALSKGSHVLCEKPAAGTIQELRTAEEAERASGRWVAIGYQWSFSPAVQALKADIRAGLFGAPRRLKCLYLWPRDEGYYARNDWAGRKRDAEGGWVLDSPVQNAMAHDLHNMLYVLGRETDAGARPASARAELYRANAIENFDTAAARIRTDEGVEILFLVSHASAEDRGPVVRYEFEKAVVRCDSRTSGLWAEFPDGRRKDYGVPDAEPMNKLWQSIEGAREGGARPVCGLAAAASQTLCMNGIQDSMPEIRDFPAGMVRTVDGLAAPRTVIETPGAKRRVVEGLDEALAACYEAEKLPSELGLPWSAGGEEIDLREYAAYPSR